MTEIKDANVRSPSYFVATAHVSCWHCGSPTLVLGLAMPQSHEVLDDELPSDVWHCAGGNAFLFYVEGLPDPVRDRLAALSPLFRRAASTVTLNSYWANHCEHCGTLLGDHELHCEPEGPFMPSSEASAAAIELLQIHEPFEAVAAGYALEPEFFGFMRKR